MRPTVAAYPAIATLVLVVGCCQLFPGQPVAQTGKDRYDAGDMVAVTLENRSAERRRIPSPGERSVLERYSGARWVAVPRFPEPSKERPEVILTILNTVEPCSEEESHFPLPTTAEPGTYRIRIPEGWVTNAFQVGPTTPPLSELRPTSH